MSAAQLKRFGQAAGIAADEKLVLLNLLDSTAAAVEDSDMLGNVQMKVGGTALAARLEYNGIVFRGIGKLRRRLSRIVELQQMGSPTFSVAASIEAVTVEFEVPGYRPTTCSSKRCRIR